MIKIKFSNAWLTLAVFFLTTAVCAQQETTTGARNFSTEPLVIKREFSLKNETEINESKNKTYSFAAREYAGVRAENNFARRQTYVAPTREQRFKRYASDAFAVPALIGATFGATVNQIGNNPPEWEKSVKGFGKRFASSYATNAIRNTISYGLSEAFKVENRLEKSGQKGFGKRIKHVLVGSYTTRTRTGKRLPDFPYVVGAYGASVIANEAWYPDRYSYQDGLRDGTVALGVRFGINLLREFFFPE